ncbi:telomerase inhibitor [Maudiozyma exigua]|uniref:Protein PXR1 n=1 Tax=Maudiozyma exigua TaxID=34358 RepID=A0A9P6WEC9_MAUEX|nr:telomerase inhibitor [Kazachstania exigua]
MGLAATRVKQRFGNDPRNTNWSNDTSRFGHQQLQRFGWKPGMGLGMSPMNSHTSHIKVHLKDDNVGLGAKISKNKKREDEFDNGECAGLDVFQRILGRLNGKETKINQELEIQRKQKIIDGKWGIHFVKADILASTWDPKTKKIKSYSNEKDEDTSEKKSSKRKRKSDNDDDDESSHKKKKKKSKHDKKKSKKTKKDDKLDKKAKKAAKKQEKKAKKAAKKESKKKSKISLESSKTASNIPIAITTRLSVRSKWIKQKRAAVMDSKALNEIFMIKNE